MAYINAGNLANLELEQRGRRLCLYKNVATQNGRVNVFWAQRKVNLASEILVKLSPVFGLSSEIPLQKRVEKIKGWLLSEAKVEQRWKRVAKASVVFGYKQQFEKGNSG